MDLDVPESHPVAKLMRPEKSEHGREEEEKALADGQARTLLSLVGNSYCI